MKKFRKLSLVLAMSLVLTQMPFTGAALTWAEPADESVSGTEAGRQDAENSEEAAKENDGKEKEEAAKETVSAQEEAAQETVSGQKEEVAAEEEAATGTVSGQDEEVASGNSVSCDAAEAENEEAAGGSEDIYADSWVEVQEAFNNNKNVTLNGDIRSDGTALIVSENTTVTLDLNGHIIDRAFNTVGAKEDGIGSAIWIKEGNLTLTDRSQDGSGSITGGYAQNGGGVDVFSGGTFTMQGGNISGNKAVYGGGVYVWENSTFTMTGGKIENNTAYEKNESIAPAWEYGNGGGVYVGENSTFTMTGGEICDNEAPAGDGGGVYVADNSTFTMKDGNITGNNARNGGGVYVLGDNAPASFNMRGGEICDNEAPAGDGGGVYLLGENASVSFNMSGGMIQGNTVFSSGGGIYANSKGGTVSLNMTGGSVYNNVAGDYGELPSGFGGGIYLDSENYYNNSGKTYFTMTGGSISNNRATADHDKGGHGGGIYSAANGEGSQTLVNMNGGIIEGNSAGGSGGGVYIGGVSFNMTDGYIGKNEAVEFGGGVAVHDGSFILGNGSDDSKHPAVQSNSARLGGGVYVQNAEFTMNKYTFIQYNTSTEHGGGVRVMGSGSESAVFNMYGGNICSNGSEYGGGVHVIGNGGTVSFNMIDGQINNNTASRDGGGIYLIAEYNKDKEKDGNAYFNFSNGEIGSNKAANYGGGIYTKTSGNPCWCLTDMTGGKIVNNQAKNGGGVYVRNSGFTMTGGTIGQIDSGNSASKNGGGVYIKASKGGAAFTMNSGAVIAFNHAGKDGGGVYVSSESEGQAVFDLKDGNILNNCAEENGGGIASTVSQNCLTRLFLEGGSIYQNKAGKNGGGLATDWNISQLGNVAIEENYATELGGGAFINGGQLTLSGGSISKNKAGAEGGGVYTNFYRAAQFNISGNFAVNGNTVLSTNPVESNVVLADCGVEDSIFKIRVFGKLSDSTRLGIRTLFTETGKSKTAVITNCLSGNGTLSNFIAEGGGTISLNSVGELEYIAPCAHDGGFTIVGAEEANCTEPGSTGEKHCSLCGALMEPAEVIPINPDNHYYDEGEVTKPASRYVTGETTYTCERCGHKKTLANIPCTEEDETSEDKKERDEDTMGADGKPGVESKTGTDEKTGEKTETISVQGKEVSKIVTDPQSGKETVESLIWIGGLSGNYTYTGSAIKPSFRVYDGMKKLAEKTDYTVVYSENKDAGPAKITVKFKGNYKGTAPVETGFTIDPAKLGTDVVAHDLGVAKKKGAQKPVPVLTFAATGKAVGKKNYEVTYDREVKDAGDYIANIEAKNGNYTGSTTALVKVTDKNHLLENAKVTFNPSSYDYTGKEIVPDQSKISVKLGSDTLVFDRDIRIASIYNNILPGNATVIIEAISSNQAGFAGTKTASFKIKGKREIKDEAPFEITVEKTVPYAKGGAKASVTVKDGQTTLKPGTDYTVSFKKNKAVTSGETAEAVIKGKGSYKGSVTRKFAVKKQDLNELKDSITAEDLFTVRSKVKKAAVTVIDLDGKKLAVNKDYTVGAPEMDPYPENTEVSGNACVTVTGKGNYEGEVRVEFCYKEASADLSKVKAGKIKDQAFTGGQVKLNSKDLENILYTGSKASPSYLKPGEDFEIKPNGYTNNVKKGTAKVVLLGKGRFAGRKTVSFKIKGKKGSYQGSLVGGEWK